MPSFSLAMVNFSTQQPREEVIIINNTLILYRLFITKDSGNDLFERKHGVDVKSGQLSRLGVSPSWRSANFGAILASSLRSSVDSDRWVRRRSLSHGNTSVTWSWEESSLKAGGL